MLLVIAPSGRGNTLAPDKPSHLPPFPTGEGAGADPTKVLGNGYEVAFCRSELSAPLAGSRLIKLWWRPAVLADIHSGHSGAEDLTDGL
jgi:hypothetical protein